MTVREYLQLTNAKKLDFYISPNNFESIIARNEKWGNYSYPTTLAKWLDKKVDKVFVMGNGTLRIFAQ